MTNSANILSSATEAMAVLAREHGPLLNTGSGLQIVEVAAIFAPKNTKETNDPAWCVIQGIGPYTPPTIPYPIHPVHAVFILLDTHTPLDAIQQTLLLRYPPTHLLLVVRRQQSKGNPQTEQVWHGPLSKLADVVPHDAAIAIYIPPLPMFADQRSFAALAWVVMRLLGPKGCPWDRKQTFQSLRAGLLEEVYEVLEALDSNDMVALSEELGDLLLQVLVHSEMARQAGHFQLEDVLEQITGKLIRRHPHVFDNLAVQDSEEVLNNWEAIKNDELREKGRERTSVLDGVPHGLPALATAQKLIKKASRTGFNWHTLDEVWAKIHEEMDELVQACKHWNNELTEKEVAHIADELGDVLFTIVTLASWLTLDAESALREANSKFRRRFTTMERLAHTQEHNLADMSTKELLALWAEAKREDR